MKISIHEQIKVIKQDIQKSTNLHLLILPRVCSFLPLSTSCHCQYFALSFAAMIHHYHPMHLPPHKTDHE